MKEHEYANAVRQVAFYFLAAPAIILIGMAIVGTIIDSFTHTQGTFSKIFVYIGGIPGIAAYYYVKWKEFSKSSLKINESIEYSHIQKLNNNLERLNEQLSKFENNLNSRK